MDSREFARKLEKQVAEFCATLDGNLPAYSYIPLTADEARIKVMQSRLFNEIRAGEIFGGWLKSTPELDVKKTLARAVHEEYEHAVLLEEALRSKGAAPMIIGRSPRKWRCLTLSKDSPIPSSGSRLFRWRVKASPIT